MDNYRVLMWYVNTEGTCSNTDIKTFADRKQADIKFYSWCAHAAASENPIHVVVLQTIDGREITRQCFRNEIPAPEIETPAEETTEEA